VGAGALAFHRTQWSFVPKQSAKPKYILVNGDESEPGTCKDHLIFLHDPHAVIEGTIIAGLAVGAKMGFIYLRGEYRYLLEIMEKAVADAYAKGFLARISSAPIPSFKSSPKPARGLMKWARNRADGVARRQTRHPRASGRPSCCRRPLWRAHGHQTTLKTIASVPHVIEMGAAAYSAAGSPRNGGTRLFCISGHVARPGVYELPMGYNLKR